MKITAVKTILLKKQLNASMHISRGGFTERWHCVVQIETDQGISGLGEGVGSARLVAAVLKELKASLIGEDPFAIENIRHKLLNDPVYFERKGSVVCAISAIEMALWDIKGKALQQPVYQLLGGLCHNELECYASDIYWQQDINDMRQQTERILGLGFKNIKAHLGVLPPDEETERIAMLKGYLAATDKLMIDLNAGYSPMQARRAAKLWETFDLYWLEEPLHPDTVDALSDVRDKSPIPIAAGENEFNLSGFKELFDKKAVDVAMPDIARAGGVQETRNIAVLADAYGVEVSPHNFSSGILFAATVHLVASLPKPALLEVDTSGNAVFDDFFLEPLQYNAGILKVWDTPGWGVQLTQSILDNHCVAMDE